MIAGGKFYTAGDVVARHIARYNPTSENWSAMGSGLSGVFPDWYTEVDALAVLPGGDVIVGGSFTTAGGVAANNIARYNPTTGVWSALGGGTDGSVLALAVLPGGDVIVGGYFTTAGGVAANNIARYNPTTGVWSALGSGTNDSVRSLAVLPGGDVIVGGEFWVAGGEAANLVARYNPITGVWSALGSGLGGGFFPSAWGVTVVPGGEVIVIGDFSTAGGTQVSCIARYNPITGAWSSLGDGVTAWPYALAILPDGDVICAGDFRSAGSELAYGIARYSPTTGAWSALGGGTNNSVFALAVLPTGIVFLGGDFTGVGGVLPVNSIARYNLTSGAWSTLESGTNNVVDTLAVVPGGDVILGGRFFSAGGVTALHVARYNPGIDAWSSLGTGTNGDVGALSVLPGGDVIVGGSFTTAGGVAANRIARLNPAIGVWSALGSGVSDGASSYSEVAALAVLPGGDIIVGGNFFVAGGVAASNIARYNPYSGAWSALGTGTNGNVSTLAVLSGGDIIVGGRFTTAGGVVANRIARFNPVTGVWSALGTGVSSSPFDSDTSVSALAVLTGGDVIVGGYFGTAGGAVANNIARLNPTTGVWSAVGSGTNSSVYSLAVLGSEVIVGGGFTTAGGAAANRIARLNQATGAWSSLGSGVSGGDYLQFSAVRTLAVLPGGDVGIGGDFTTAGTHVSAYFARCVLPVATSIVSQPQSTIACIGSDATFYINALGSGPLAYQWQGEDNAHPGTWINIADGSVFGVGTFSGATTPTMILSGITPNAGGRYRCSVTNPCGSAASEPALLSTAVGNFDYSFDSLLPFGNLVGQDGWQLTRPSHASPTVAATACGSGSAARATTSTTITQAQRSVGPVIQYRSSDTEVVWSHVARMVNGTGNLMAVASVSHDPTAPPNTNGTSFVEFGSRLCRSCGETVSRVYLFANGVLLGDTLQFDHCYEFRLQVDFSFAGGRGTLSYRDLTIGQAVFTTDSLLRNISLQMPANSSQRYDVYWVAVETMGAAAGAYSTVDLLHVDRPATVEIASPPQSVASCPFTSVTFSVGANGTGPFAYQWRKNGEPISAVANPSAVTATLMLANVQVGNAGSYDCVVSHGCRGMTSDPAQLFVDPSDMGQQGGVPSRDGLHDNNDFVVYIDLFFNQQPAADIGSQGGILGSDGQFDNNDFVVFIDQFFATC